MGANIRAPALLQGVNSSLPARSVWAFAARQHGVITWQQMIGLGYSPAAIRHRISRGRLHFVVRGVYAVGRPDIDQLGVWIANVLRLGPEAILSHGCAAALWR